MDDSQDKSVSKKLYPKIDVFNYLKCSRCQSRLESECIYCPDCGSKVNNELISCKACGALNNAEDYCFDCGSVIKSKICSKCNTETYGDFCESCGNAVSDLGQIFLQNSAKIKEPESLSKEEANDILNSFQARLTPETKRMQEKMRQRIILQREREIFQEREERIKNYHSSGIKKVELIQTEEFKKIREQMKTFSGYLKRKVEEKEAEERRVEEARQAEEKRIWMMNRVNGLWVSTVARTCITLDLTEVSSSSTGKMYAISIAHDTIDLLQVNWNGSSIDFYTIKTFIKWIAADTERRSAKFSGRISDDGEMMTGYMSSAENWQEVFIKN